MFDEAEYHLSFRYFLDSSAGVPFDVNGKKDPAIFINYLQKIHIPPVEYMDDVW
jgi:hypothetical protein